MLFLVLQLWLHLHERNVFSSNYNWDLHKKKSAETRKKNIRNVKNVGMACQKVCKQGRDDA